MGRWNSRNNTCASELHKLFKISMSFVKGCYIKGCNEKPVAAHSVSEKRVLARIAKDGKVMCPKFDPASMDFMMSIGKKTATTFRGFCQKHDREMFSPIDNNDYEIGNQKQNFLFAFRAAAREMLLKQGVVEYFERLLSNSGSAEHAVINNGLAGYIEWLNQGQKLSVDDQKETRRIFNDTYFKEKYNVINTCIFEVDKEIPIAASSSFNLETSDSGELINDVFESGYANKMKPCFLTIFPQNGKTFCLISYFRRDRKEYSFLENLIGLSEREKEVIISNLLASYVENFAINPDYWGALPQNIKNTYANMCVSRMSQRMPLISDPDFNFFDI